MLAIAIDVGAARLGYGLLLPAIRGGMAGSFAAFGFVATAHFAGYLTGSLATPFILRYDRTARLTPALAQVAVAATLLISAAATTVTQLAIARATMGLACGVGVASVITGALERVEPAARGRISGRAWAGIGLALIVCAPITPWLLDGARFLGVLGGSAGPTALFAVGGAWQSSISIARR